MGDTLLLERYARVLDRIDAACASAGRPPRKREAYCRFKTASGGIPGPGGRRPGRLILAKTTFRRPCKKGRT